MDHSLSARLVIHILNHLLPYVMVAHQHLCTLWVSWLPKSAQKKVSHRSIVRLIGTYLSLKPQHHRLYFQTVRPDHRCSTPFSEDGSRRAPVSLADVAMLEQEEPLPGIYISCELGPSRLREETARRVSSSCVKRKQTEDVFDANPAATCNPTTQKETPVEDAAMQRISALEAELNKLRAQIALMATMQTQQETPSVQQGTPSVQQGTPQAPPPAPPPPPPPPPPPGSLATPVLNIKDIIKKNKLKKSGSTNTPVAMPSPAVPNMMAVLKDMSNVKLRSVERSPGGTPVRQKPKESDAQDPAALIAQALRRKFAHRKAIGSPDQLDKENDWPSPDGGGSPKFGRGLLKPVRRRRSSHSNSRSRLHSAPSAVHV